MVEQAESRDPITSGIGRLSRIVCLGVILISVLSCVLMAAIRSTGLTQLTMTALDENEEPRDHNIPLLNRQDALPDYRITIRTSTGTLNLGARPNESGVQGLTWKLNDPVSIHDLISIRLDEEDKVVSDALAEVQFSSEPVTHGNYRFEFSTERSYAVGLQSFFKTAIGKSIAAAFAIAVLVIIFSIFSL